MLQSRRLERFIQVAQQLFHLCKNDSSAKRMNRLAQFFRNGDLPLLPIELVPTLHPRSCCAMNASGARFPKTSILENSVSNCFISSVLSSTLIAPKFSSK